MKSSNKKTYNNNCMKITKATIRNVIVALLLASILLIIIYGVSKRQIDSTVSLIKTISIKSEKKIASNIVFNKEEKKIKNRPEFATKYAQIKIESLGIDLPLYYGDTLSILRNGAGQSATGYFPGEGGTVVCLAHNTENMFKKLPEIQNGAKVTISTSYGEFEYEVYDTKIVNMKEVEALDIQKEEERLDLYTCYPVTGIGHKTERFIAYARLVNYD